MRNLALLSCAAIAACAPNVVSKPTSAPASVNEPEPDYERGRALFTHNWTVGDPWSAEGDGLGPHFNATSCVACHGQGGIGGSGGQHHNVMSRPKEALDNDFRSDAERREQDRQLAIESLAQLGLKGPEGMSNVFGPGGLGSGINNALGGLRGVAVGGAIGPRNSTALFGIGLLDAIPDDVIVDAAKGDPRFPRVKGQVSRTPDGRVGRFGWKADVPTLAEFVSRACAIEIGLEVPGVPQRGKRAKDENGKETVKLDLALEDVVALTDFVSTLPQPTRAADTLASLAGERVFDDIGCTACHREQLGNVENIYSDLLLHDLGPGLSDAGGSWGTPASSSSVAQMWRTPPLWGVRDSGPYLHDGRAQSIDAAIRVHGGSATDSAHAYMALSKAEQQAIRAFLESLVAPGSV